MECVTEAGERRVPSAKPPAARGLIYGTLLCTLMYRLSSESHTLYDHIVVGVCVRWLWYIAGEERIVSLKFCELSYFYYFFFFSFLFFFYRKGPGSELSKFWRNSRDPGRVRYRKIPYLHLLCSFSNCWLIERVSKWNEWVSERMSEWVGGWVSEWVREWVSEWIGKWVTNWYNS